MAQVQNVKLTLNPSGSTVDVSVSATLSFESAELGTTNRLAIDLYGVELPNEGPTPLNPPPLYTFHFGPMWNDKEYTTIKATNPKQSFSFTRSVPRNLLNEDPGYAIVWGGLMVPYPDEIRATVTLSQVQSAVSQVVSIA
jgi:hypothetical protein